MQYIDLYDHLRSLEHAVAEGDTSISHAQEQLASLYDLLAAYDEEVREARLITITVNYVTVTTQIRFGNISQTVHKRVIRSHRPNHIHITD